MDPAACGDAGLRRLLPATDARRRHPPTGSPSLRPTVGCVRGGARVWSQPPRRSRSSCRGASLVDPFACRGHNRRGEVLGCPRDLTDRELSRGTGLEFGTGPRRARVGVLPTGRIRAKPSNRAGVTQLVECQLPKLNVAGSNPVSRSTRTSAVRPIPRRASHRAVAGLQANLCDTAGPVGGLRQRHAASADTVDTSFADVGTRALRHLIDANALTIVEAAAVTIPVAGEPGGLTGAGCVAQHVVPKPPPELVTTRDRGSGWTLGGGNSELALGSETAQAAHVGLRYVLALGPAIANVSALQGAGQSVTRGGAFEVLDERTALVGGLGNAQGDGGFRTNATLLAVEFGNAGEFALLRPSALLDAQRETRSVCAFLIEAHATPDAVGGRLAAGLVGLVQTRRHSEQSNRPQTNAATKRRANRGMEITGRRHGLVGREAAARRTSSASGRRGRPLVTFGVGARDPAPAVAARGTVVSGVHDGTPTTPGSRTVGGTRPTAMDRRVDCDPIMERTECVGPRDGRRHERRTPATARCPGPRRHEARTR